MALIIPSRPSLEDTLADALRAYGIPEPVRQWRGIPGRQWRFDFAWPAWCLAVEVEGGMFLPGGGRHQRAIGFARDTDKYNALMMLVPQWALLRFTTVHIRDGRAAQTVARWFLSRGYGGKE